MPKIFIAYDFLISGTLRGNLHEVTEYPPANYQITWPGDPDGRTQGEIWRDVVKANIEQCDGLLAFVDKPNANVGFEIGYGLGRGKCVALGQVSRDRHSWLKRPPLSGLLINRLQTPETIHAEINRWDRTWNRLPPPARAGQEVLVLCPEVGGAAYRRRIPASWRTLPADGWGLKDLPDRLAGVGLVVWMVCPHDDGPEERDGDENSAFAVVAGYAAALPNVMVNILWHREARDVADVVTVRRPFINPSTFQAEINRIKEDWEEKLMQNPAQTIVPVQQENVIPIKRLTAEEAYQKGQDYEYGRKVKQNYTKAAVWYREAAEKGHVPSQLQLGVMYSEGMGVENDDEQAFFWFHKAAEQGSANAQFEVGEMYRQGRGVTSSDSLAAEWYIKAAEQGDVDAQYALACLFDNGRGLAKDSVKAFFWFHKAAEQNHVQAQSSLGALYENGWGTDQNELLAADWYKRAAEQGDADAQANLGMMYEQGRGVKQSLSLAILYYRKAAKQGDELAAFSLRRLNVPEAE